MEINIVKLLEDIGYSTAKATATKIFGGYSCEIEKAKEIITLQSMKSGKYSGKYLEFTKKDLTIYSIETVGKTEKTEKKKYDTTVDSINGEYVNADKESMKQIRNVLYDKIFIKIAERQDGLEIANKLVEEMNKFIDSKKSNLSEVND